MGMTVLDRLKDRSALILTRARAQAYEEIDEMQAFFQRVENYAAKLVEDMKDKTMQVRVQANTIQ